jgi:hypothetical protein
MAALQAAMIDSWNVSDIQTDKVFRDIAEQQLGPILQVMHPTVDHLRDGSAPQAVHD